VEGVQLSSASQDMVRGPDQWKWTGTNRSANDLNASALAATLSQKRRQDPSGPPNLSDSTLLEALMIALEPHACYSNMCIFVE